MLTINNIIDFINTNILVFTLIPTLIVGIWEYYKYKNEWNFKNYHKLIKELNQSDTPNESIKLYRQVAVVYEMRNYPKYFQITKRILNGWLESRNDIDDENNPLYKEMNLTIKYIDTNRIKRFLIK